MSFERTEGDLAGLLHLIHLETELMIAAACINVFGSLPEGKGLTLIAYWAGYEFTMQGLAPLPWHSVAYADVASSVRSVAEGISKQDWEDGCEQAKYELSQLE